MNYDSNKSRFEHRHYQKQAWDEHEEKHSEPNNPEKLLSDKERMSIRNSSISALLVSMAIMITFIIFRSLTPSEYHVPVFYFVVVNVFPFLFNLIFFFNFQVLTNAMHDHLQMLC